ncbi:hypothetical protein B0I72DRAFT_94981 [Yarrowia lipolytica]|uniref:Inositol-1-monophosphatase n=1 Tax=Yarrowia lipolytica TaxID=4952 RepID=A0A371CAX0_YARLL|nr:hypothetical protein B0I71DRAFT_94506 [Yarrowia lipolytica]RDW33724.1 hypothetical protein B0I72DRAFT_94981 [Yarrowia lipolytica]RDW40450.1 hypothetical protein B0I73DRAFT_95982 [Yarrowia lipolytica]RDW48709.1 hypothetical protein B0I74DRAFT_133160 [Yarrowia lipolytica]RDW54172.1 hypothetical protein B0I75DRAFT_135131 [Yarrowia lipolytica]
MSNADLTHIESVLTDVALKAGAIIKEKTGTAVFEDKKNAVDLVTETDKAVEDMIREKLSTAFPDFKFMGEESFSGGDNAALSDAPTFIVDPIDGTTNFIHGFPYACTSLGLSIDKEPVVGVIYNPFLDHLYTGVKDKGSYLITNAATDSPIKAALPLKKPAQKLTLQSSIIGIEWGSDRVGNNFDTKCATFRNLSGGHDGAGFCHGFRSLGSAAMNFSAVAAGYLDAYWEGGCWAWDVCAGWVILKEAGGFVAGGNKGVWNPPVDSRKYLAVRSAPEAEQKVFVEEFWGQIDGSLEYDP